MSYLLAPATPQAWHCPHPCQRMSVYPEKILPSAEAAATGQDGDGTRNERALTGPRHDGEVRPPCGKEEGGGGEEKRHGCSRNSIYGLKSARLASPSAA
jgi:hypothetical protein